MARQIQPDPSPSLAQLATSTPDTRDRYVDFLRAFSIAVVVIGHWLMAIVFFNEGRLTGANALEVIPGLWLLTWVLQVMPLFFFVGGFSNLTSIRSIRRRGGGSLLFIRNRAERLLRPTLVFVAAWMVIAIVLERVLGSGAALQHGTALVAKPVWFLAVYLLVIALSPAMLLLHERFRWFVPAGMALGAVTVDVVRIAFDLELIGYLNFAFVWLFAHQLGFFYADGTLTRISRRTFAAIAVASLACLVALTNFSVYSRSMVGTASERVSNNDPPSVCIILLTLWLIALAMLMRGRAGSWLSRPRNWAAVIAANSVIMTVFLWHLTALLVAVVVAYPLGFPQFEGGSAGWWLSRPIWLAVAAAALAPFVVAFARFERPRFTLDAHRPRPVVPSAGATTVGIALLVLGMGGFAQGGFAGALEPQGTNLGLFEANPLLSAVHLAIGTALLRGASRVTTAVASAGLVGLGMLEAFSPTSSLLTVIPVTGGNAVLHLLCGCALSVFGIDEIERRSR
ncbi:MAG: acyltransferase family protein [Actinomycetota bacterium]|nr:acyltransferase family protein [Actinomycetota bacterium]